MFASSRTHDVLLIPELLNIIRENKWIAFSFGGIPRGLLDSGSKYQPRDLDLVFDDNHFLRFAEVFRDCIIRRNSFGGLKMFYGGVYIDAWPLSSTWAFRTGLVKNVSFETLPSTTFLNIDGIIVEAVPIKRFKARRIYEHGFFCGLTKSLLDINMIENPHPEICFTRTLHIAKKFGFRITHRLAVYLWEMFEKHPILKLQEAEKKHYGKVAFEGNELLEVLSALEKGILKSPDEPVRLFPMRRSQMRLALQFGEGA